MPATPGAIDTGSLIAAALTQPGTARGTNYYLTASEMNTQVLANIRWLQDNAARLSGAAFTGNISTSGTLGVTGATTLSTASLAGALSLNVEAIFTGLGTPPSAPAAGKGALYLDSSLLPKVRTPSTTYTIPYLELAQTWILAQTFSTAAIFSSGLTVNGGGYTFSAAVGTRDFINLQTSGTLRWIWRFTNDAESGGDVGSNLALLSRTDAGASKSFVLFLDRGTGRMGLGGISSTPTAMLDINSDVLRLRTAKTPASAAASGNAGDICWDSNYVYVCVSASAWKRVAIATW